ncbi:hypothetical protein VNO78_16088 [Psophocarpus tetragonolobus]|uniref:Uncharacterized protein n=1 Tax=Psophocarpus tetragonolobus TaxID=3891 RepID=A0AAN9SKL9_PSOTE
MKGRVSKDTLRERAKTLEHRILIRQQRHLTSMVIHVHHLLIGLGMEEMWERNEDCSCKGIRTVTTYMFLHVSGSAIPEY